MFGLRFTTKRELALFAATIDDLRRQISKLEDQKEKAVVKAEASADYERRRAEAAINALLAKSAKIVITPESKPISEDDMEAIKKGVYQIFGEEEEAATPEEKDKKIIEGLQL